LEQDGQGAVRAPSPWSKRLPRADALIQALIGAVNVRAAGSAPEPGRWRLPTPTRLIHPQETGFTMMVESNDFFWVTADSYRKPFRGEYRTPA